ncbi:hypothetical protein POM88_033272 [Heracleum sosnowskyi]|uniref:Uncharacterized protein n=1 Tax=Heracleum sosnowskyi TaxID=360622 RepID=A0AAD8I0W5_9APIA|nr:hypothetical protein POM88_033272 [Heracleum sosnowskyi]
MRTKPVCEGYCLHIYDAFNSFFQRREFVVPPHIKEFCDLALEKYNNEKDTNYRYVCPLFAEEKTKAHVTTHSFLFKASASDSDPYAAEPFKAIITSGFRFSDGSKPSVKDLQQVSVVSVVLGVDEHVAGIIKAAVSVGDAILEILTDPGGVSPNWKPYVDDDNGEADLLAGSDKISLSF